MQDILTCAMGLDIHRDVIVTGLAKGELGVDPEIEIPSFSTLIPDMRKLRDWVLKADCHHVAMKSTGIYCQPIYEMLEGNPYLKSVLCEVRWVTSGKRTLYLAGWYWRIKQRKGATCIDCFGSQASGSDLHDVENRFSIQRRMF
jgi:hypothetical protein